MFIDLNCFGSNDKENQIREEANEIMPSQNKFKIYVCSKTNKICFAPGLKASVSQIQTRSE